MTSVHASSLYLEPYRILGRYQTNKQTHIQKSSVSYTFIEPQKCYHTSDVTLKGTPGSFISQLARKSGPTSGRQRYDVATSYRCQPDVGPTFLAGWVVLDVDNAVYNLQFLLNIAQRIDFNGNVTLCDNLYLSYQFAVL